MLSKDSSEQSLPEFDKLANLFVQAGAFCSPAEFHGTLCGHLAAGGRYDPANWLLAAAEMMEIAVVSEQELSASLQALYQASLQQLGGSNFEFALLLPEDETPMSQRAKALGEWCHGFLGGYGMAGGSVEGKLSDDALDAMQDMVQISQIAAEQGDDPEAGGEEADFFEVYEYVRMSAMLIFSECNQPVAAQSAPAGEPLH